MAPGQIVAGLVSEFTVEIAELASYLKLTPQIFGSDSVVFDPEQIVFRDFESRTVTFRMIVSQNV